MTYAGRWPAALAAAREHIVGLGPSTRAALIGFDDVAHVAQTLTGDHQRLLAGLDRIEPRSRGTDFGLALSEAGRLLAAGTASEQRVVLISDLQRTGIARAGSMRMAPGVALELIPIKGSAGSDATTNVAVTDVRRQPQGAGGTASPAPLSVRIRNTAGAAVRDGRLDVTVNGRTIETRRYDLEPGEEKRLELAVVIAGDRPSRLKLVLEPDGIAVDNAFHLVLVAEPAMKVLRVESDHPRTRQGYFLDRALSLSRSPPVELNRVRVSDLDPAQLLQADVVILDDVPVPGQRLTSGSGASAGTALSEFVASGGGLLVVTGDGTRGAWPGGEGGFLPGRLGPVVVPPGGRAQIVGRAANHPLFKVIGETSGGALRNAQIWRYRSLQPDSADQVVAGFQNGGAALVERAFGRGRSLVLTTTADARWGSLALQPGFVPLMVQAARYLADRPTFLPAIRVGEALDVRRHAAAISGTKAREADLEEARLQVETPQGARVHLSGKRAVLTPERPGFYEIHRADSPDRSLPVAVNPDPAESEITSIEPKAFMGRIERHQPRLEPTDALEGVRGARDGAEEQQRWWRLVLAIAFLVLVLDSALANRLTRRRDAGGVTGR